MTQPESPEVSFKGACLSVDLLVSMVSVFAKYEVPSGDLYDIMVKQVRAHVASAANGDDLMVAMVAAALVKLARLEPGGQGEAAIPTAALACELCKPGGQLHPDFPHQASRPHGRWMWETGHVATWSPDNHVTGVDRLPPTEPFSWKRS